MKMQNNSSIFSIFWSNFLLPYRSMMEKYLFQYKQAEIQWEFSYSRFKTITPEPQWTIYVKYIIKIYKIFLDIEKIQDIV